MRTHRPLPARAAALTLAVALASFTAPTLAAPALAPTPALLPAAAAADEIDAALAELDALVKAGDETKAAAKITELEAKSDPRVSAALGKLAANQKLIDVSIAAIKAGAKQKSPEVFKYLKGKIDDDKMFESHQNKYFAVLENVGAWADKSTGKALADVSNKYIPSNGEVAKRAILAYGSIREAATVEQLLKWMQMTENTRGGGGKTMSDQQKTAYGIANRACLDAMQKLTLLDMPNFQSWSEWWEKNAKGFKFPDPNAEAVDPATLTEWTDPAYGMTMKRPAEAGWAFAKMEFAGGRVEMSYRDPNGTQLARCRVMVYKADGKVPNLPAFIEYFKALWEKDAVDKWSKPAEASEKVLGGRKFSVLGGRGLGKGDWKAWSSMELRIYASMPTNGVFYYMDCLLSNGAEEPVKSAFWDAIEGVTFKK